MRQFDPKVTWRAVDKVTPYPTNAKKHSEEQVARLAGIIAETGWDVPIVVDADGIIIKGHRRRLAALRLGLKMVPVIERHDLTPAQVKAARLADNNAAEGEMDMGLATIEVRALEELGADLSTLGFSDADLAGMLARAEEVDMPALASGDKEPFQQMTFQLHDEQAAEVKRAIELAHGMGKYDSPNKNRNGNALARICETFVTRHG